MQITTWQFLIQREGDRSWLPIEAGGEIPEGRYRLAARTSYPNASVAAEIAYIADRSHPSHPKIQRRSYQTNATGLLMLFPYSKIRAGTLTVRCIVHPTGGTPEQYHAKLHVLNQDADGDDAWENWQPETADSMPASTNSVLDPLITNTSESSATVMPQIDPRQAEALRAMISTAQFQLASEAIVANSHQPIQVDGQVQLDVDPSGIGMAWQGVVQIVLHDPQTTEALTQVEHGIQISQLEPLTCIPFTCSLTLPDRMTTHVLLGDIALYVPTVSINATPLATESFTVTAGLQDLLKELASSMEQDLHEEEEEVTIAPSAAQPAKRPLDMTFVSMLNSAKPVGKSAAASGQPSSQPSSPLLTIAQTSQPKPSKPKAGSWQAVQLPALATSATQAQPDRSGESSVSQQPSQPDELLTLIENLAIMDDDAAADNPSSSTASEHQVTDGNASDIDLPNTHLPNIDLANVDLASVEASKCDTPSAMASETIDSAFRGLNLQQRFWARLNDLVGDAEMSNWVAPIVVSEIAAEQDEADEMALTATEPTATEPDESVQEPMIPNQVPSPQSLSGMNLLEDIWLSQEIVVDDDFSLPERKAPTQTHRPERAVSILPDDYPLPLPELHVPAGELIAGKSIPIRVTIPDLAAQLCVKLWFVDYQTRSVIDEPRWLVSFMPDGAGNVETVTYVTVPMGSVEIQIAAIVIEIPTQRESHRSTVERKVVPPNLPALALEALEL